jgi:hypothetical protein
MSCPDFELSPSLLAHVEEKQKAERSCPTTPKKPPVLKRPSAWVEEPAAHVEEKQEAERSCSTTQKKPPVLKRPSAWVVEEPALKRPAAMPAP